MQLGWIDCISVKMLITEYLDPKFHFCVFSDHHVVIIICIIMYNIIIIFYH